MSPDSSVLCVDIGGTSTKLAIVDASGALHHTTSIPTSPDAETFFQSLVTALHRVLALTNRDQSLTTHSLGIAVAGFLDDERTCLFYNPNLSWLERYPLLQRLKEHFPHLAIELEVDSNAAAMAEYSLGSGQGSKRFLCLTSGTGLGVGMVIHGSPLRFAYGCMGDIGHNIVLRDGPLCACGGRGCAEVMVSSNSLASQYKLAVGSSHDIGLRQVIEASQSGDALATSILVAAGEWLGLAAASMANAFFPDHIAIAGGLSAAGEIVISAAEQTFRSSACSLARATATFSRAVLGPSATLIGAAWPFWPDTRRPR